MRTTYAYMIFATPKGKGYGCFGIQPSGDGQVNVSAAFCSPVDRPRFRKPIARQTVLARLSGEKCAKISVKDDDVRVTVKKALECMQLALPSWVDWSLRHKTQFNTLSADQFSGEDLIMSTLNKTIVL